MAKLQNLSVSWQTYFLLLLGYLSYESQQKTTSGKYKWKYIHARKVNMHEIIALNYKPVANGAVYTRMDKNEEIITAASRT